MIGEMRDRKLGIITGNEGKKVEDKRGTKGDKLKKIRGNEVR